MFHTMSLSTGSDEAIDLVKLLVLGDSGVGKSSLIQVFKEIHNDSTLLSFSTIVQDARATIGPDFINEVFQLSEDRKVKLTIWDTAGQEKYRSINRTFYAGANGILVCFDLTKSLTIENIESWMYEIRQHVGEECSKVIVGNKYDGAVNEEAVGLLTKFAVENKLKFIQTSALEGTNVYFAFEFLVKKIDQSMNGKLGIRCSSATNRMSLSLGANTADTSRSCC